MPLGMEVGLGPDDFVLDGDPAPPQEKGGTASPNFWRCLLWPNGRPSQLLLSYCYVQLSEEQIEFCQIDAC